MCDKQGGLHECIFDETEQKTRWDSVGACPQSQCNTNSGDLCIGPLNNHNLKNYYTKIPCQKDNEEVIVKPKLYTTPGCSDEGVVENCFPARNSIWIS